MRTEPRKYVSWIGKNALHVYCADSSGRHVLSGMAAKKHLFTHTKFTLKYASDQQLAEILTALRDSTFCFVGGVGWSPSAVFEDLRDKGFVKGAFLELVWAGSQKAIVSEK
jgi:hypothetical protein